MANSYLSHIEKQFWPRGRGRDVWMIVDGARDRRIFGMLMNSYLNYSCLYSGAIPPELEIVAPHLVQLEYEERYSRRLIERAWGNSWGSFLRCDTSLELMRRHLRGLLSVRDMRGKLLLFRYYDPRVLRVYLPTCRPDELRTVFGPVERFWVENESPETMLEFRFDRVRLLRSEFALEPAKSSSARVSDEAPSVDRQSA
jgi:hypothetical protein